ncbi:membrane protein insertase YidC [Ureibacillus sp. FSL K6-8385]|uniref:Membrane protein insertase YidC n=1 Tax=Ureibacillus terrenus TaxID=118246 RepID=A0A540V0W8_9BACL|nr:membrane protein insertase YidC [Ureibacillus terrenus]MED3662257.1 membrane protein insertase YidC [Ureibacillus terrenus]MED3764050.1 membrane protein insertase YidC [Ureibacillus terrenus]TQE90412.1 membrane protein insertase YidC [Ureibacillus terrenus]
MKRLTLFSLFGISLLILSGCQAVQNQEGFFYHTFVKPMDWLLNTLGEWFGGSYGLAIIVITIIVRLILMPFMLRNYRQQSIMKTKMDLIKPKMDEIQEKLKKAKTKEEQMKIQQEMMALYREHNINPFNLGCLPILIQFPIIMGLYYSILYSNEVKSHEFLWFNLGSPDLIITAIAGLIYFIQAKVSLWTVPEAQKQQMKMMVFISPIMIVFISLSSMAALPLYWSVSGLLLIFQTYLGRKYYSEHAVEQAK